MKRDLKSRRIAAGLSLAQVALYYKNGVTREYIRQVESVAELSSEIRRNYLAALRRAVAARERVRAALRASRGARNEPRLRKAL